MSQLKFPIFSFSRLNLQMTVSSGRDFKKTAIIPMRQQSTELKRLGGSGTWPWTREGRPKGAAAQGSNPSMSPPTSYPDSSSRSNLNFPSRSLYQKRKSHLVRWNQRSPCRHLAEVPAQLSTDWSFALDDALPGLVGNHYSASGPSTGVMEPWRKRSGAVSLHPSAVLTRMEVRSLFHFDWNKTGFLFYFIFNFK